MQHVSVLSLLVRLVLSMGVVLALMVLAARVLKGRAFGGVPRPSERALVRVLGRQSLGRTASVAVVRAGGRTLVLGVTEGSVSLLAEADPDEMARELDDQEGGHRTAAFGAEAPRGAWTTVLETLRERTVRRP